MNDPSRSPQRLLTVPAALDGARLDRALEELCPDLSRARLQKLVRRGGLKVGGRRVVRSNGRVRKGDELKLALEPAQAAEPSEPARILHQDEDLLVLDKPPGILTHPKDGQRGAGAQPSLAEWAGRRFGPLPDGADCAYPGVVHRLDRGTSGLILVALSERGLLALKAAFRERRVEKRYLALVLARPKEREFEVDLSIGPSPDPKADRMRIDREGGKPATTLVRVAREWEGATLLECRPHTGRRHQIRVHLASAGMGIVGDPLYGPPRAHWPAGVTRPLLHAAAIAFEHPADGRRVEFECPLAEDFAAVVEALGAAS